MELDRVENYCELNREKWLPTNGIQFLNEERFAKNLLKELDENDEVAKLFSEYRPAVKPGSEADKFRNKSLARMGSIDRYHRNENKSNGFEMEEKSTNGITPRTKRHACG